MRIVLCDDDTEFTEKLKSLVENGLGAPDDRPVISIYHSGESFLWTIPAAMQFFLILTCPLSMVLTLQDR